MQSPRGYPMRLMHATIQIKQKHININYDANK